MTGLRLAAAVEADVRAALANGVVLTSSELLDVLQAKGYGRPRAAQHIRSARILGLILRISSRWPWEYRLQPSWVASARPREMQKHQPPPDNPTAMYTGPVFDRAPLVPSLGRICGSAEEDDGELPPMVGARLVANLQRNFDEIFQRCE